MIHDIVHRSDTSTSGNATKVLALDGVFRVSSEFKFGVALVSNLGIRSTDEERLANVEFF